MIAGYEFYQQEFRSDIITGQQQFDSVAREAEAVLNRLCDGRIDEKWMEDDRVKLAFCALCDEVFADRLSAANYGARGRTVASESTGSHHVTFADSESFSWNKRYQKAAALYLWDTGLLSRVVLYRRG